MARSEFEHAYYDFAVHRSNHYPTKTWWYTKSVYLIWPATVLKKEIFQLHPMLIIHTTVPFDITSLEDQTYVSNIHTIKYSKRKTKMKNDKAAILDFL